MQFVVNYPHEYITSVEGTYARPTSYTAITSLVFKTSRGRTSPTFGNNKFVLANNGKKLVGFHGRSGFAIDALGAHFSSESSLPMKLEAQGGLGGGTWDDGVYSDIRKVYVGRDGACVTRIMVDYVKNGGPETRAHGLVNEELQEVIFFTTLSTSIYYIVMIFSFKFLTVDIILFLLIINIKSICTYYLNRFSINLM